MSPSAVPGVERTSYARPVLIAIEGVDGAGKRTLTDGLRASFEAAGKTVAHAGLPALPPVGARRPRRRGAARRARRPVVVGVRDGDAVRARPGRRQATRSTGCAPRTTSSSSTATSRPTPPTARRGCIRTSTATWSPGCGELEFDRFALPAPDWQVLLAVPDRAGRRTGPAPRETRTPTAPATPTNATTVCSAAPARPTPRWPPRTGAGAGSVAGPDVDRRAIWRGR